MEPYLTRIGDVTIERVAPRKPTLAPPPPDPPPAVEEEENKEESPNDDSIESSDAEESKIDGEKDNSYNSDVEDSELEEDEEEPSEENVEASKDEPVEEVKDNEGTGEESEKKEDGNESDDTTESKNDEEESKKEGDDKGESKKRKCDETDGQKKKQKKDGDESSSESDSDKKKSIERKAANMRRNIREVMDESELDEETKAAQRQEMERIRRLQEQQRIIREVQKQIMMQNRQRGQRINLQSSSSLLRQCTITATGGSSSSASAAVPSSSTASPGSQVRIPSSVLMKLAAAGGEANKKVIEMLTSGKSPGDGPSLSIVSSRRSSVLTEDLGSESDDEAEIDDIEDLVSDSEDIISITPRKDTIRLGPDVSATPIIVPKDTKPKGKELVTISSSSEDEDCVILSGASGDESEPEDVNNCGMHTNDLYNQPDEQGRVLINVGHPKDEPDIFLAPQIARAIKPHQIGGLRFLYDNVIESLERYNTTPGFGCILAHSMGLGKTLQVIAFCDVFLRHTPAKTVLCIMPINTLQNWLAEFNMWLPEKLNDSQLGSAEDFTLRHFPLLILNDSHKSLTARAKVIREWHRNGGVLLMGYELYRQLSLRRDKLRGRKRGRRSAFDMVDEVIDEGRNKLLWDEVHQALVKPGPDLVICDEGHRIKNSHASISHALKSLETKRRVVLTGYPLQNNLIEYWCMVDFVRPNYLGTKTEFCNMFERPIQNGQCVDSTPQDIRLMRYRAHVLHSLLEGFVQRRSHSVLQISLPQKEEYVLLLRMTAFQRALYNKFMNEVVRVKAVPNPLKAFAVCCKIWNHPDVLYYFLKKTEAEEIDLDIEDPSAAAVTIPGTNPPCSLVIPDVKKPGRAVKGRPRLNPAKKDKIGKPAASINPTSNTVKPEQAEVKPLEDSTKDFPTNQQQNNQQNSNYQYYQGNSNYPEYQQQNQQQFPDYYNQQQQQQQQYNNQYYPDQYNNSAFFSQSSTSQNYQQPYWQQQQSSTYQGQNYSQQNYSSQQQTGFYNDAIPVKQEFPSNDFPRINSFQGNQSQNQQNLPTNQQQNRSQGVPNNQPLSSTQQNLPTNEQNISPTQHNLPPNQQNISLNSQRLPTTQQNMLSNQQNMSINSQSMHLNQQSLSSNQQNMPITAQSMPLNQQNVSNQQNLPVNQQSMPLSQQGMLSNQQNVPTNQQNMPIDQQSISSNALSFNDHVRPTNQGIPNIQTQSLIQNQLNMPTLNQQSMGNRPQNQVMPNNQTMSGNLPQETSINQQNVQQNMPINQQTRPQNQCLPSNGPHNQQNANQQTISTNSINMMQPHQHAMDINHVTVPQNQQDMTPNQQTIPINQQISTQTISSNPQPNLSTNNLPITQSHQNHYLGNQAQNALDQLSQVVDQSLPSESLSIALNTDAKTFNPPDVNGQTPSESEVKIEGEIQKPEADSSLIEEKKAEDKVEECVRIPVKLGEKKSLLEIQTNAYRASRDEPSISYDWAMELLKFYEPGHIESCAKMEIMFCILEQSITLGDRMLVFSQSLFTLNLIEDFLQRTKVTGTEEYWARNVNYYRLDGSTSALEREKLINEYNSNPKIHLFLVSTRAGSLGINLVGANRVVVFDASWNPCHDTQAVCRVYRYGQRKPCFVYRLVMDHCLEKKIYDRQINKQGMADRVVDELNPDAHLSIKDVSNLLYDSEPDEDEKDFSGSKDKYIDVVLQKVLERHSYGLSKEPFQHESLLVDRKEKKLSQAERRLAKRNYELEKQATLQPRYQSYNVGPAGASATINTANSTGNILPNRLNRDKPIASVRPMQADPGPRGHMPAPGGRSRWIPAETWQRQGMSAQEMTLPLDVVIPTNAPDRASIVLKAGQRVMVLKSPKGIYMQLENGKIIAIRTALKMGDAARKGPEHKPIAPNSILTSSQPDKILEKDLMSKGPQQKVSSVFPLKSNSEITITPRSATMTKTSPSSTATVPPNMKPFGDAPSSSVWRNEQRVQPTTKPSPGRPPLSTNQHFPPSSRPFYHQERRNSATVAPELKDSHSIEPEFSRGNYHHPQQQQKSTPNFQTYQQNDEFARSTSTSYQQYQSPSRHQPTRTQHYPPMGMSTQGKPPDNKGEQPNASPGRGKLKASKLKGSKETFDDKQKKPGNEFSFPQFDYYGQQQQQFGYFPPSNEKSKAKEDDKKKETPRSEPSTSTPTTSASATSSSYNTSGGGIIAAQPNYSDPYAQGQYGYPGYRNSSGNYSGYPPYNQQYPDAATNSAMYSAFHRPEAFASSSDLTSFLSNPFMPSSSTPHFPTPASQVPPNPYYSQNVYPPTPGYPRPPYPTPTVDAYHAYSSGFSPFLVPPSTPGYPLTNPPTTSDGPSQ